MILLIVQPLYSILRMSNCLLGVEMDGTRSRNMQHILSLAFLVAKRTILINWKERKNNCFSRIDHWRNDVMDILAMEQAALSLNPLERTSVHVMCVYVCAGRLSGLKVKKGL